MKSFPLLMGAMCAVLLVGSALAGDKATKPEAEAMVKKAVEFLKANGPEKAYTEFDNKVGAFHDRDLYITVYDMTGKCLAHGANAKLIGKDLSDSQDIDGKYFVKERTELAKVLVQTARSDRLGWRLNWAEGRQW
jgi:cytochrome c